MQPHLAGAKWQRSELTTSCKRNKRPINFARSFRFLTLPSPTPFAFASPVGPLPLPSSSSVLFPANRDSNTRQKARRGVLDGQISGDRNFEEKFRSRLWRGLAVPMNFRQLAHCFTPFGVNELMSARGRSYLELIPSSWVHPSAPTPRMTFARLQPETPKRQTCQT